MIREFFIDLFSGAGGTTTGIHLAEADAEVVACVNHDENAILSHKANHPDCLHFVEDVRDYKVIIALKHLVERLRKKYPDCVVSIWASLECTNYSKAKGGLPREADSRTLAYTLFNYADELQVDKIYVENVREFLSWGPLDETGRPVSRLNGLDYQRWVNYLTKYMGYTYDHRILNAADFGAYQSRERYFGIFSKDIPIAWPEATHCKNPKQGGFFQSLLKWKPVKEVLDLNDEGVSIFERDKPLVEKTLERIYAGLVKFVAGGEKNFLMKYYSGKPHQKVTSLNLPAGTVKTKDGQAIVFLNHYYGNGFSTSVLDPCPTLRTKDGVSKIEAKFFINYYSGGGEHSSIDNPSPVITSVPKPRLTSVKFLVNQNSSTAPAKGLNDPCPAITARTHYLLNPQFDDKGRSLDDPCFTLIARMDKKPPYLVEVEKGRIAIAVYETDSPAMVKIKEFMAIYGIVDIKMRMLKIIELLRIQGFPEGYILKGTKTQQKKYIGNAVEVNQAKALIEANFRALQQLKKEAS